MSTDLAAEPTATFTAPLSTTDTEKSVVVTGTGGPVAQGDSVLISYALFNATSGKRLDAGGYGTSKPLALTVDPAQYLTGLTRAIDCSTIGSRIVAVIPPAEAFGTTGSTQLGIAATDSIVFVVDVVGKTPTMADGAPQPPQAGFPTVALAPDGKPTVTIPQTAPPADLRIATLKKGTGAVVADGATVTVQYQGSIWASSKVFDQSWGAGPKSFKTSQVIPGFSAALVGQTVGSQVIVIIPPDKGYGAAGQPSAGISGTDTLVFVVDILSAG